MNNLLLDQLPITLMQRLETFLLQVVISKSCLRLKNYSVMHVGGLAKSLE